MERDDTLNIVQRQMSCMTEENTRQTQQSLPSRNGISEHFRIFWKTRIPKLFFPKFSKLIDSFSRVQDQRQKKPL